MRFPVCRVAQERLWGLERVAVRGDYLLFLRAYYLITAGRYVFERSCSVGKLGAAAVKDLDACIVLSVERSDRARTARFHNILRVVEP